MPDSAEQLVAVQETLMHVQRELEQMHEVVLAQQTEIANLRRELTSLRDQFERNIEGDPFPTPAEDRPPHY